MKAVGCNSITIITSYTMLNSNLIKSSLKLFIFVYVVNCHNGHDHEVATYFSEHKVVPNVIAIPPKLGLKVV